MMRSVATVALLALAACGGDSVLGTKDPTYPAVAGTYVVSGGFNGVPTSQASLAGTLTFQQPSREASALAGAANITVSIGTSSGTFTSISNAMVTPQGTLSFDVTSTGTSTWKFSGTVSGTTIVGTHILSGLTSTGNSSFVGTFTAVKQ